LAERRGARNFWTVPALSLEKILAWADAFHERTQTWPHSKSGPILEAPGETWTAIDKALRKGRRGLSEVSSLAQVLARERGVPNRLDPPPLTIKDIVAWADAHFQRTARWPTRESGPVDGAPQHSWRDVNSALRYGHRGLPGWSSLARLLHDRRRKRNPGSLALLSLNKILAWADAHHSRTGQWPKKTSGPIDGAPGEEWRLVDNALHLGLRGLQGESSLLRLLKRKRGVRDRRDLPPLTEEQILRWADQHFQRRRSWPNGKSGPIAEGPGETWTAVDIALRRGKRGLAGGSSLAQLLSKAGRGKGAGSQERTPVAKDRDHAKPRSS
jgi:hypothetical protein